MPFGDGGNGFVRQGTMEIPTGPSPAQLAYEREQQRQAQIKLQQDLAAQQGASNIDYGAKTGLAAQQNEAARGLQESAQTFSGGQAANARAADAAKQAAAIAEGQRSQSAGIEAQLRGQHDSEAAKLGLQNAGAASSAALAKQQAEATQRLQAESEGAAATAQGSSQGFQKDLLKQQADLQAAAEARRMAALQGLLGGSGFGGGVGGTMPPGASPGVGGGSPDPIDSAPGLTGDLIHNPKPGIGGLTSGPTPGMGGAPDSIAAEEENARTAAFARAKDQAGLIGRSALTALQGQMAGRGMSHSGSANSATGQVINQGATQLGDVNREQAINTAANARARASEKLANDTTRRGQNIGLITGLMNSRAF